MSRYSGDDASVVSAGSIRNTRNLCFNDTESSPGNLEQTMDLSDQFSQSQGLPSPSGQAKVNSRHALRDSGPGARHGYHGVRLPDAPRSVRLYGSAPCMRSSVDEIVFNRDMDMSGEGTSPEMEYLVKCFEGGAGQKDAMADLMGYVRHSEKQRCVRMYGVAGGVGESQLDEVIFGRDLDIDQEGGPKDVDWFSHAGCKTREKDLYGRKKKLWPEGPIQSKHGAAEVVFGQEKEHLSEQDQKVIDEHYTNAAGTSLHFGRTEGSGLKRPEETWKKGGKRIFDNTPMNKSVMNRVLHQAPVNENEDQRLSKLYAGAAGTSVRYNRNTGCVMRDGSHTEGVVAIHH